MTAEQIKTRLLEAYSDAQVEVTDLTGTHDHYQVAIKTDALKNKTRIHQHKEIMAVFAQELKSGEIHAFTLKTSTLE